LLDEVGELGVWHEVRGNTPGHQVLCLDALACDAKVQADTGSSLD
jgi:hypothetical protein